MVCVYTKYFQEKGCQPYVLTNFRMENEYSLAEGVERTVIGEKMRQTKSRIRNYIQRLKVIREECKEKEIETAVVFARANSIRFILATLGMKIKIVVAIRISPEREFPGAGNILGKNHWKSGWIFVSDKGTERFFWISYCSAFHCIAKFDR